MKRKLVSLSSVFVVFFLVCSGGLPVLGGSVYTSSQCRIAGHERSMLPSEKTVIDTCILDDKINQDFQNPFSLVYSYSFPEPVVSKIFLEGQWFSSVVMPHVFLGGKSGKPHLPVQGVSLVLPAGMTYENIEVTFGTRHSLLVPYPIVPGIEPIPFFDTGQSSVVLCDETIYGKDTVFPGVLYSDVGLSGVRGYEILTFQLHPVQYFPLDFVIEWYELLEVSVSLKENAVCSMSLLVRDVAQDRQLVAGLVDNPNLLRSYASEKQVVVRNGSVVNPEQSFDFVIITTEDLKHADGEFTFQDLVQEKQDIGISTVIVTVEEIVNDPAYWVNGTWGDNNQSNPFYRSQIVFNPEMFNDTTAKIRNFIRDAYWNWDTQYVLLGGDNETVPARTLYYGYYPPRDYFGPSDVYFSCLEGNFNANENDKWGEGIDGGSGTDVDLGPEVFVGRACVDDSDEVSIFVSKTLRYMQWYPSDVSLSQVLLVGEHLDDRPQWGGRYLDELINGSDAHGYSTVGLSSEWYTITRLYDLFWQEQGWPEPNKGNGGWPKSDVIDLINSDVHLINHVGHASIDLVMKINRSDVYVLNNSLPHFIYSQGCDAGAFHFPDSIAEHLVFKTEHGAVAMIANVLSGFYTPVSTDSPSQRYHRMFWDALCGENRTKPLSWANHESKVRNLYRINDEYMRWIYYGLNLFGDPTLRLHPQLLCNIGVESVVFNTDHIMVGGDVIVNTSVYNNGYDDVSDIVVKLLVDGMEINSTTISYLASMNRAHLSFVWNPDAVGQIMVSVTVSAADVVEDTYQDNEKTERIRVGVWNWDTDRLFNSIQEAVDDEQTADGHTIRVPQGAYHETVVVNKNIWLKGEHRDTTVLVGDIKSPSIVTHFDSDINHRSVLLVKGTDNVTISDFTIRKNDIGVSFIDTKNTVMYNIAVTNNQYGLVVSSSAQVRIQECLIQGNVYGVTLTGSSTGCTVRDCVVTENTQGIMITDFSHTNMVFDTVLVDNKYGMVIDRACDRNIMYHNVFDNAVVNAVDYTGNNNKWDRGYYADHGSLVVLGGNWWSDYTGVDEFSGPKQRDPLSDGIGDTPYSVGVTTDRYPLMSPWTGSLPVLIFVDDDNVNGPWTGRPDQPFVTIQDAIDYAHSGATIFVYGGTYPERVVIDTSVTLLGQPDDPVVIDGANLGHVVTVVANDTVVRGLTIHNSASTRSYAGMFIQSNFSVFSDNHILNQKQGITLSSSTHNILHNNSICEIEDSGILLDFSSGNVISNNTMVNFSTQSGTPKYIKLAFSNDNTILGNTLTENPDSTAVSTGIEIAFSGNNRIAQNILTDLHLGIEVTQYSRENHLIHNMINNTSIGIHIISNSDFTLISENTIQNCLVWGIRISNSLENVISKNVVLHTQLLDGISVFYSAKTILYENTVSQNKKRGIDLHDSPQSVLRNNTVSFNEDAGISITGSSTTIVVDNTVSYNHKEGIWIQTSHCCTLYQNRISDNTLAGLAIIGSVHNDIYHNSFINQTITAYDTGDNTSTWDFWQQGFPAGGNYWGDYVDAYDFDGDGIADEPYIGHGFIDRYPLMQPFNGTVPIPNPPTVYVHWNNTEGPWDGTPEHPYRTIEDALLNVESGSQVYVYSGSYHIPTQGLTISKTLRLIGEDAATTILDNNGGNRIFGIQAEWVTVTGFTFRNSYFGISLLDSIPNVTISHNIFTQFTGNAINLAANSNILIFNNTFTECESGVRLNLWSTYNIVFGNIFLNNTCGIYISSSPYIGGIFNLFYHNTFMNNTDHAIDLGADNQWNMTYPMGGNYWDNHPDFTDEFSGPSQDNPGSDGIVDTPYPVTPHSTDEYPFMQPFGWLQ